VNERTHTAVLYDRQPMWLEAIEGVLARADVRVEGKAADIETAIALIGEQNPDLFITDAEGDDGDATIDFEHLRAAQAQAPGIKCIVLASSAERQTIEAAFSAGAFAYVLKSAHPDDLASAVRQAFHQSIYVGQAIEVGTGRTRTAATTTRGRNTSALDLTRRERQILCLVAEGHSNAQLAAMLWVTEQTVKFHLSNVYRKIDVTNRTEAARWAQLHGLLTGSDELPISA
jgi:DNA-binding NarL/FixJ family response regulator